MCKGGKEGGKKKNLRKAAKRLRDRRMGGEEMSNGLVCRNRERLGKKVSQVDSTREMGDSELKLRDPIPNPMEAHVDRLAHLCSNGTVS